MAQWESWCALFSFVFALVSMLLTACLIVYFCECVCVCVWYMTDIGLWTQIVDNIKHLSKQQHDFCFSMKNKGNNQIINNILWGFLTNISHKWSSFISSWPIQSSKFWYYFSHGNSSWYTKSMALYKLWLHFKWLSSKYWIFIGLNYNICFHISDKLLLFKIHE